MTPRVLATALLFSLAVGTQAMPHPGPQSPQKAAAVGLSSDKGKFRILLQGTEAGTETFELSPSGSGWLARGETILRVPGSGENRATGQLRVNPDGTPTRYEWTSQTPKKASGSVTFTNGEAKTSVKLEGKDPQPADFKFTSPRIAVLDNNLYDQYAILAVLYDWNAKGSQSIPVIIPQDSTPGSIDVSYVGPQTSGGASLEQLRARTADLEVELFYDAKHHLIRIEVPAAQVVIVRQ